MSSIERQAPASNMLRFENGEDNMPSAGKPPLQAAANAPRLYKVFVSSTYLDNVERRKVVQV